MNKDRKILDFDISGTGDMERAVSIQQYDSLPAWIPGGRYLAGLITVLQKQS